MILFDRVVTLTLIGRSESRTVRGVKINFKIEKTDDFFSNKAKIEALNLAKASFSLSEQAGAKVRLDAGYDGKPGLLFFGDVTRSNTERGKKGGDIATTIEAGDGERSLSETYVELSFARGGTNQQVVDRLIQEMGLVRGVVRSLPLRTFARGYSFSGRAREAMDEMVIQAGYRWSIQNGEVQIVPRAEGTGEEAAVISATTGLLNIPSKGTSGESESDDSLAYDWKFETLLNNKVAPGRLVLLETERTGKARLRVTSCVHEGDSEDGDFKTTAEAVIA